MFKTKRYFDVAHRTGNELKRAITDYLNSGKKVEPHLRRAHWHGYWKGSKNNMNRFFSINGFLLF